MRIRNRVLSFVLTVVLIVSLMPAVSAAETKLVALTFDDGPGPYTERLLTGLEERGARATFFCLGNRAELYPDLVQRMITEGHQVANHSYSHPNLNDLSVDAALQQISKTDQILNGITGAQESYYIRPPYGNTTQMLRNMLCAPVVIWSVDTIDWQILNGAAVEKKILSDTFDGSIVLMHDIHSTTIDGILAALDTLQARGYEFVTVKELVRRRGIGSLPGQLYYRVDSQGHDLSRLKMPEMTVSGTSECMEITFVSPDGAPVYYTTDGTAVTCTSERYETPFTVQLPCTIRAVAAWDLNGDRSDELCHTYELPPAGIPTVFTKDGTLCFEATNVGETVFVKADSWLNYLPEEMAEIPRDTWFSYYSDGEGLDASPVNRLLFTKEGNLTSDLQQADWHYAAMDQCITKGYYKGSGQWKYDPTGYLTRAMLIELLFRYDGADGVSTSHPFVDIMEEAYYSDSVKWAYSMGIAAGVGGGRFAPDRPVTRQELAKILAGYLKLEGNERPLGYQDEQVLSDWAAPYVFMVSEAGLMVGAGGFFRPAAPVTRAEFAAVLMRMDDR